jgi:hypothetical protein
MHPREHLDGIRRDIEPTDQENRIVQQRITQVTSAAGRLFPIAELHPAGSWAKGTMLRGRKEADLVAVLARAPDSATLDLLRNHFADLEGLQREPDTSFKSVNLVFRDGVAIDLLPVARTGTTPWGPSIPQKLRHALDGIQHVQWLKANAHGTVTHPLIRLMKHVRNTHKRDFHELSSFAVEVLCVSIGARGDLYEAFTGTLTSLRDGWLTPGGRPRRLADPADPNNNLFEGFGAAEFADIARRAGAALDAIKADSWTRVFPTDSGTLPPPAGNLGGRTLG